MNKVLMAKLFPKAMERREKGRCPFCNKKIDLSKEFKDNLSFREYRISGLCQNCQDKVFKDYD